MSAETVNQFLQRLAAIDALQVPRFKALLAAPLKQTTDNPYWTFYEFEAAQGPFRGGELRLHKTDPRALLILTPRDSAPLTESDLNLQPWGEVRNIDINPGIPPEGTDAYIYAAGGVRVTFQFTHQSRRLRTVALEWGAGA